MKRILKRKRTFSLILATTLLITTVAANPMEAFAATNEESSTQTTITTLQDSENSTDSSIIDQSTENSYDSSEWIGESADTSEVAEVSSEESTPVVQKDTNKTNTAAVENVTTSTIDGFTKLEAENYDTWSDAGLITESTVDDLSANIGDVSGTYNGAWLAFASRNFSETPASVTVRYVNNSVECASNAALEIRLGSNTGTLLQTIPLTATGATWTAYNETTVTIASAASYTGTQDLYFVLTGTTDTTYPYIANLDYIKFTPVVINQKAINLNIGSNQSERNITWYADNANAGSLKIALKSDMTGSDFPTASATTYTASVQSTNDTGFYSNQLTMTGLTPDTEYVYQLINGSTVSQTYSFKTGSAGNFSFLFAGDPQIGASGSISSDTTGWSNTVATALSTFTDTDFIVSAGDQVNTSNNESQYTGYLSPSALTSVAVATVIGNHDSTNAAYSQHFDNSNDGTYGITTAGSDYWYVYNNVLFMNLNSNNLSTAEHKTFMEAAIASNPSVDWKIVVFHHSLYSVADHAYDTDVLQRRDGLSPVLKDLGIDVVLMGHDHVYVRSYMMSGQNGETPLVQTKADGSALDNVTNPQGVLYVTANSSSGSKYYAIKSDVFAYSAVQKQQITPNISNVSITPTSFTITTYKTNDMSVVDSFTINHDSTAYNVTFDSQGGSNVATQSGVIGSTVTAPADPTKTGYTFGGWYKDAAYTTAWDFTNDTVAGATTIYAKWNANAVTTTYAVNFNSQGGSDVAAETVVSGAKATLPTNPTKEGYTFDGWYKDAAGTTAWNFSNDTVTANTTVYAKWTAVLATSISLDKTTIGIAKGKSQSILATVAPSNALNKAVDWTTSSSSVATVDSNGLVKGVNYGTATITVKAKDGSGITATCKVTVGYSITYKLNGGSNASANPSAYDNEKVTLKDPSKKGYTFKGWYTDKNFNTKITSIKKGTKKDYTVYAKWEKISVDKANITSLKNSKSLQIAVKLDKVSNANGYEITYATDKNFTTDKQVVTSSKTSYTLKSLIKAKTYYVKVRAYVTDSAGNKVYGKYSSVSNIKVSK